MTELLNCPFCGGSVSFHSDDECDGCHYIHCQGCDAMFDFATTADPENVRETMDDLREAIAVSWNRRAQPAEADGVEVKLRRVIDELKAGFVVCQQCGEQEDTATLDCVPELEAIADALSAVTAERDRLRVENSRAMQCACEQRQERNLLAIERDRLQGQNGKLEQERDQLRAEVEGIRKDAERYRWVTENCDIDYRGHRPDGDYASSDEAIDAALAAKEGGK